MAKDNEQSKLDAEVLVIGAGLSGIFTLYRLQQLGITAIALEAGSGEGGTWFWNRYPGVRFDSESISYGFSFSQEVLDEWNWTEAFAPGEETLQYARYLTDKFDLRRYMRLNTTIKSAYDQEYSRLWRLTDANGRIYSSRFLVTAMGVLNKSTPPSIPGLENFRGQSFHTSRWPSNCDLEGEKVGIIGTGATGIQIIQEITEPEHALDSLTVFQRTPNWSAPLRNESISAQQMQDIKARYSDIFDRCKSSYSGFIHVADKRKTLEVPEEERLAFWEELYSQPGFAKWLANFADINTDAKANAAFIAEKIRQRVNDPVTAEKLIPRCHGFGSKRVPLETNYFEAYNKDNVRLIDIRQEAPIESVTPKGIQLSTGEHVDLDVLILATGFDAITGSFSAIDFQGISGMRLQNVWSEGPRTFLGMFVDKFPNMMMVLGPHQMVGNISRSIEYAVTWITALIQYCKDHGFTRVEARQETVEEWTEHVFECARGLLANDVDSWMSGVNKNVKGKQKRIIVRYNGPGPGYRKRCHDIAARGYEDLDLS